MYNKTPTLSNLKSVIVTFFVKYAAAAILVNIYNLTRFLVIKFIYWNKISVLTPSLNLWHMSTLSMKI